MSVPRKVDSSSSINMYGYNGSNKEGKMATTPIRTKVFGSLARILEKKFSNIRKKLVDLAGTILVISGSFTFSNDSETCAGLRLARDEKSRLNDGLITKKRVDRRIRGGESSPKA